jgi:hypothetical protein
MELSASGDVKTMMNPEVYFREAERMEKERICRIQAAQIQRRKIPRTPPQWIRETLPSGCILYRLVTVRFRE